MTDVKRALSSIIRELADVEIENDEQELNLSSFDTLKIVIQIEQELGVCIDDSKIFKGIFNSLKTLDAYINALL